MEGGTGAPLLPSAAGLRAAALPPSSPESRRARTAPCSEGTGTALGTPDARRRLPCPGWSGRRRVPAGTKAGPGGGNTLWTHLRGQNLPPCAPRANFKFSSVVHFMPEDD